MVYGVDANYTFNNAGVFVVTLTLKDAAGNTHTDTVEITVNDTTNPVANASADQTVDQHTLVIFNGSSSTDNIAVTNYTWTFTDGSLQTLYGAGPNYTFDNAGAFVVTLTTKDAAGNTHTDTVTITVNDVTDPTAMAGDGQTVDQRDVVVFNGSASTDNLGVTNYTWTFSDGGLKTLYGAMPNYTFQNVGNYTVTLNVSDAAGNWKTGTTWVNVSDIDAPVSGTIWNNSLTTGDLAFFSINLTDNVGVNTVWFNYTINGMTNYNWSVTNNTNDDWTIEITIPSYAELIEYYFWFNDDSSNKDKDATANQNVSDNDDPVLSVQTNSTLTTGDDGVFRINITDNIAVNTSSVLFYFSYGGGVWHQANVINQTESRWTITMKMWSNAETFQFYFKVNDTSENQKDSAPSLELPVKDNDVPTVGTDLTTDTPKTGEGFTIICKATDNIGVYSVSLNYTYDGGATFTLVPMTDLGDGNWSKTITVSTSAVSISYNFSISDEEGNVRDTTKSAATPVVDTIPPEFLDDVTVGSPVAGEDFTISVLISDNTNTRGLVLVQVNYSVNGMTYLTKGLTHTVGNYYNTTISVLSNATSFIYHIYAKDAADNEIDRYNPAGVPIPVLDTTAPVASAGSDKSIGQGQNVTFNGSQSHDAVGVVTYKWNFTYDGKEVVLNEAVVNYTFNISGVYVVWLNITDAAGNWHTDNLTVTVADITDPMAVPGGNLTVDQGGNHTFNASGSSDNDEIDNYTWTYGGKKYYGLEITLDFEDAGVFMLFLKVKDMAGNTHEANLTITVKDITNPTADAGDDLTKNMGTQVFFNGADSTDNVGVVTYTWTFKDGVTKTLNGSNANYTFDNPGVFKITLTVEDAAGNTDTDYFNLTVADNIKPMAKATADDEDAVNGANATAGDTVELDASTSSDNVGITVWNWTIESPDNEMSYYSTKTASHKFADDGTYTVTLTVKDAADNIDSQTFDVKVKAAIKTVTLGPFNDKDGNPVEGFDVIITVGGVDYKATTNKDGEATFKDIPTPKSTDPVVVKDEDGNEVFSGTYNDALSSVDTDYEPSGILLYVIIAIIVVVILVVLFFVIRKKPEEEEELYGEEVEDEELVEGEGEMPDEGVLTEGIEAEVVEFQCPECGSMVAETDDACPGCGVAFEEEEVEEEIEVVQFECPECGSLVNETDAACPGCGVEFEEEVEEYIEEGIMDDVDDLEAELGELEEAEEIGEEAIEDFSGDIVDVEGEGEIAEGIEEEGAEEAEESEDVEDVAVEQVEEEVEEEVMEEAVEEEVEEVAEVAVDEEVETVDEAVEEAVEETAEETAVEEDIEETAEEEIVEEALEDIIDDDDFDSLLEGLEDEL
ncbi:MAG: PKD domain-containing protein [Candidatus Thermoplasmatota archaeon]|nr:PKD domain-containing protein [Candidatus Thermoplasmatota archaeon]